MHYRYRVHGYQLVHTRCDTALENNDGNVSVVPAKPIARHVQHVNTSGVATLPVPTLPRRVVGG
jgi:hypothetical protein